MANRVSAQRIVAALAAIGLLGPVSSQEVIRSRALSWDFSGQPIPRYKGGFLTAYDSDHATVRAFDQTGALVAAAKLTLPDAANVVVRDAAVAPSGDLVAAASAQNASGALCSVIAWIDRGGRLVRAVRTSPFAARQIIFAEDGNLWAAGRVHDDQFQDVPDHEIMRVYDQQGRIIRSVLPRGSFAAGRQHPLREAFIASGNGRIGLYSASASEWVEVSLSGELLGRWQPLSLPEGTTLMGAALTSSGDVYLGGFMRRPQGTGDRSDSIRGVLFRLDKANGKLTAVDIPAVTGPGRDALLLSADGERLVYYCKSPRTVEWVAPRGK